MPTNMDRVVGIATDAINQVTREGAGFTLEERTSHMAELQGVVNNAMAALEAEAAETPDPKEGKDAKGAKHEEGTHKGKKAA